MKNPKGEISNEELIIFIVESLYSLSKQRNIIAFFIWIFFGPFIGSILGSLTSLIIGLLFEEVILETLAEFGIKVKDLWRLGATFGFLMGFMPVYLFNRKKSE